jgi:hypothetical protein
MLSDRSSIMITSLGLAALLAAAAAQAQDAVTQPDPAATDVETAFDDFDDPIWPVRLGVDPAADRILRAMSEHLAGAKSFTYRVEVAEDVLLDHGQMVQYGGVSEIALQRPGSVHARFRGEERNSNVVLHAGKITLHNLRTNMYAQADVPPLIDDAIDAIVDRFGINVPMADLISADPYAAVMGNVDYGYVVGTSVVDGAKCHHLAFSQQNIDWQVWIETGPHPLVRKFVITYKDEEGWPQYTARISEWDLSPRISTHHFEYEPPKDARKIDFLPNQAVESEG